MRHPVRQHTTCVQAVQSQEPYVSVSQDTKVPQRARALCRIVETAKSDDRAHKSSNSALFRQALGFVLSVFILSIVSYVNNFDALHPTFKQEFGEFLCINSKALFNLIFSSLFLPTQYSKTNTNTKTNITNTKLIIFKSFIA